jgi:molybdopterin/thiamine biosynthesis adenylyltransferase/rhodanese-related sulfurtransferase
VDADLVEPSNLQRQILHSDAWIGKPKLASAAARLREVNAHVRTELHPVRLSPANALEIASNYDVIIDGTDNFPTRYLTNDTAFFLKKPLIYGAIHRFSGQTTVFASYLGGPCYRCLVPEMPAPGAVPSCQEAGVLGVLPGIIGSLQTMEALKLLLGIGTLPLGKLTCYDALESRFRSLKLQRDPQCRLCGDHPTIHGVESPETMAAATCETSQNHMETITTSELREKLASHFQGLLIDVREPDEYAVAHIEGVRLIPLQTLPNELDTIPRDREILVHCKAGGRSAKAVEFLLAHGFTNVKNVTGGMDAWLAEK